MTDFNNFISEILALRFERVYHISSNQEVWSIDLSHYSDSSAYRAKLMRLKEAALTDILFLSANHYAVCEKRLTIIYNRLWVIESSNSEENDAFYKEHSMSVFEMMKGGYEDILVFDNESDFKVEPAYFDEAAFIRNLRSALTTKREIIGQLIVDMEDFSSPDVDSANVKFRSDSKASYQWIDGDIDEGIEKLYSLLNDNYIVKMDLDEFSPIFSNVSVKDLSPIKWKSDNASELLYVLTALMERGLIKDERGRMSYERLKLCFVKSDGVAFKEDFKSIKQRLTIDLSQYKQKKIDDLFKDFL